jgi:hypothetical protein
VSAAPLVIIYARLGELFIHYEWVISRAFAQYLRPFEFSAMR